MEGGRAAGDAGAGLPAQESSGEAPPLAVDGGGAGGGAENGEEGSAAAAASKRRRRDLIQSIWEENQGPYEGMEFDTREAAHVFYNEYARRVGFGTRVGSVRYSQRTHAVIAQTYVCAKQGSAKPGKRPRDAVAGSGGAAADSKEVRRRISIRSGCRALISLKKREDTGKWVIYRVEKHHNHPLVAPENIRYIRSHKPFSLCRGARHFFHPASSPPGEDTEEPTRTPGPVENSKSKPLFASEQEWNCIRIGRRRIVGSEAQNFFGYFRKLQAENPSFFYAMQVDNDRCVSNIFWADSKARMGYSYFGDAVVFDTTHKSAQLPFVQFAGVNHHGQPVLFGCALLLDDSEASLLWLFRTWLEAMSRRHPVSITTAQDEALKAAVAEVFPVTRHRVCKWDVFRQCREKLAYIDQIYPTLEGELCRCVDEAETVEEFESRWRLLIDRYCLEGNQWLQFLYNTRQEWVTAYLRDAFFGEVATSDQIEGRKSFFDGYLSGLTSLQDFVKQYEKALESRFVEEAEADFDTMHTMPTLTTPSPMEKQVASLYTRKVFTKFQEELVETFAYTANKIEDDGANSKFKVAKFGEEQKKHIVVFSTLEKNATCSCQMFESSGVLCRHVLTVFRIANVLVLPSQYILNRWTRNAKTGDVLDDYSVELRGNSRESLTLRYNNLRHLAINFVEEGASSIEIYDVAITALREAANKISAAKKNFMRVPRVGAVDSGGGKDTDGSSEFVNMNGVNPMQDAQ